MRVKQYSPFLINFSIVAKGKLKQKRRLSNVLKKLEPNDPLINPIINKKLTRASKIEKRKTRTTIKFDTQGITE